MRSWAARVVRTAMRPLSMPRRWPSALQRAGLERRPPVGLTVAHVQARTPGRLGRGPRAAPGLTQARAVSGRKPEPGHAQARRGLTPSPRAPGLTAKPMLGQVLSRARFADVIVMRVRVVRVPLNNARLRERPRAPAFARACLKSLAPSHAAYVPLSLPRNDVAANRRERS